MGFLVGILTGLASSFQNNQFKKLAAVDGTFLNGVRFAAATTSMGILAVVLSVWEKLPPTFFLVIAAILPIEVFVARFYVKAFQLSPQSLVGPLSSSSVIFLVPLSYLIFGDLPNLIGFLGIGFVLSGSFILGWDFRKPEVRQTIKNIFHEKGSYYMIAAAFLASIAVSLTKFSYQYASPLLTGLFVVAGLLLLHLPTLISGGRSFPKKLSRPLASMGLGYSAGMFLHYFGLSLLPAVYFISIKRSSVLFDVLFGKFVHNETHFKSRLMGALLMVGGLILIALA